MKMVKKTKSITILICILVSIVLLITACFGDEQEQIEATSIPTIDWQGLSRSGFTTGFIVNSHNITDFEELFEITMEATLSSHNMVHAETLRPLWEQLDATREAYISDFDYLIERLNIEFNIRDVISGQIEVARWFVNYYFHMNDMVFASVLRDAIFGLMIREGIVEDAVSLSQNFDNLHLDNEYEMREFQDEMAAVRDLADFLLPETGLAIIINR